MTTAYLLAETHMCAIGGFSASIVSRGLGEEFQHLQRGSSSLSVTSIDILKMFHVTPAAAFSLAVGTSFEGNFSSHCL